MTRTDQIGKVFQVIGPDARKCLICEEIFSRRAAAEHARVVCGAPRNQLGSRDVKSDRPSPMGEALRGLK
jgi:hypothetical protein